MDDFAQALEQQQDDFQKGQIVRGKVHSYERNGVYVDIGGKSLAFVPGQEVGLNTVTDLSEVLPLNEEREFLIIREQDAEGQLTLSLKQLRIQQAWDLIGEMQDSKQSVQVKVTGVNKGGVTVDLQGVRGFIPRSHLLERENLAELIGQNLTASFLEVDLEAKKLVLSQREATRSASFNQLELGQLIEGKVASIKPFGVFVDFAGNTGLIHVKQVSQTYIESLASLFQIGQQIKALIVDLDPGKNRISLSTKVLENYAGEMIENMTEVMSSADSRAHRAAKKLLEG
jgi:small subunit ribosomal protein S1